MLALNGIFILVTRHGLEYPAFYERLYALLTDDAFQVRHACTLAPAFVLKVNSTWRSLTQPAFSICLLFGGKTATLTLTSTIGHRVWYAAEPLNVLCIIHICESSRQPQPNH